MIGVWYDSKKNRFYCKYVRGAYLFKNYKVGYINSYGHELIALFYTWDRKLVQCNSLADYYNRKKENKLKNRLINKLICWLNKFKDKEV